MLPLSILEKTDHSILYEIPQGKPNPNQRCEVGEEMRDHVKQQAVKGTTCWYYTMNFIRRRIGKLPCEELSKDREIEKICSARRKAQTKHEHSFPVIADQLNIKTNLNFLEGIDREKAKFFLNNRNKYEHVFNNPEFLAGGPSIFPFFEKFVDEGSCKNMHEFFLKEKVIKRNEINEEFLTKFDVNAEELFKSMMTSDTSSEIPDWKSLNIVQRCNFLDFFARDVSAKAYGLHKSSWIPLNGIDSLISELTKNGPLLIGGRFGQPVYVDEPKKSNQKLAERDIYYWPKGAERHLSSTFGHTVLLVGAKKQDKGLVYFIDPLDSSDPKDLSHRKIYMISFDNLSSNICNLAGYINSIKLPSQQSSIMSSENFTPSISRIEKYLKKDHESCVSYAYYGNFKV